MAVLGLADEAAQRRVARDVVARVTGSLEVDPSSFAMATGWRPRRFAIDASMVSDV